MTDNIIKDLRRTLANMELALGTVEEAIVWTDAQGLILWCNTVFDRLVDRLHILVLGNSLQSLLPLNQPDFSCSIKLSFHPFERAMKTEASGQDIFGYYLKGQPILLEITWSCLQETSLKTVNAQVTGCVLTIRDITDRHRQEQELQKSKTLLEQQLAELKQAQVEIRRVEQVNDELRLLETMLDVVLAGYWDWDIIHNREYMSPGFKQMFGYQIQELPNTPSTWKNLIVSTDWDKVKTSFLAHVNSHGKIPFFVEIQCRHRDGSLVWVICSGKVISWDQNNNPLRVIGCHLDITHRKQAEDSLITSLQEKETLLKEIHHRVKNNLLVISSLLSWQVEEVNDPQLVQFFTNSQQRIKTMALIHEKLYGSKDLDQINFGDYLASLIEQIVSVTVDKDISIELFFDLDPILLNIETATPCGLIVNELVVNCLEHAFLPQQTGNLFVSLKQANDQKITLTVEDDGIGLPVDLDVQKTTSLGWQLIHLLTDQLEGNLTVESESGTKVVITFQELYYPQRV
jgi:PAS domain S-box-containing protein